jgi:hypothetical protein
MLKTHLCFLNEVKFFKKETTEKGKVGSDNTLGFMEGGLPPFLNSGELIKLYLY